VAARCLKFLEGHLSLHQRAPSPFRWKEYRAIGPKGLPSPAQVPPFTR
jgi:hypothetical protein